MPANRVQTVSQIATPRISLPTAMVPPGFVLVPAQIFQSQGAAPTDWQRNLYAAAFEQARQSVRQARQRRFRQSQFVAVN